MNTAPTRQSALSEEKSWGNGANTVNAGAVAGYWPEIEGVLPVVRT